MNGTKTKIECGRYLYEVGGFKFHISKFNDRYSTTGSQWHIADRQVNPETSSVWTYGGQTLKDAIESCDKIATKYYKVA